MSDFAPAWAGEGGPSCQPVEVWEDEEEREKETCGVVRHGRDKVEREDEEKKKIHRGHFTLFNN